MKCRESMKEVQKGDVGHSKRLEKAFSTAEVLPLTQNTRYILMSDCHRGTGMSYDNFQKNQHLYFAALQYYYQKNFHYIELGDGEELWENRYREQILECHSNVYWMFSQFEQRGKLLRLYGNHDHCLDKSLPESVILRSCDDTVSIGLTHGHQVDFWNSTAWKFTRFLVRYLWRPLEQFGVNDPTSAARNYRKSTHLEKLLESWAADQDFLLITGHTHRPRLQPEDFQASGGRGSYANTGSCVHPRCITGIEITGYEMHLVKWWVTTRNDLSLFVERKVLSSAVCRKKT